MQLRSLLSVAQAFLPAMFLSSLAWAQATAVSQISGVVQDATGAAVPGAQVRVTQTETSMTRAATAGADGAYTIPNLPVGPYRLEATASGFSTYVQTGIVLQVNTNPVINPVLQIGAVAEQVSVTADAAMAETHDNAISQVMRSNPHCRAAIERPKRYATDPVVGRRGCATNWRRSQHQQELPDPVVDHLYRGRPDLRH